MRVAGLGRRLLEHAFAPGLGMHRSIIATVDAPAVGLYLCFGVSHLTTGVDMTCSPRAADAPASYESARTAVDWLVGERGWRIDPFYCLLLTDGPWAKLDRHLPFNPCLML